MKLLYSHNHLVVQCLLQTKLIETFEQTSRPSQLKIRSSQI
jgi:hypothetical protein